MVTIRRTLEQTKHCVEEALSCIVHEEGYEPAVEDLKQAQALIADVLKRIRELPTFPTPVYVRSKKPAVSR